MLTRFALLLGLLSLVAGCAGQSASQGGDRPPVMTVSDFYGFCSALPGPDACLSDPICNRFKQELSSPPSDLRSCLALCQQTENALYVDNLVNGCAEILGRAEELCDQFCRRRDRS